MDDTPTTAAHVAARAYARRGWLVFPAVPRDKIPAVRGGFYAATTNPATIDRWWHTHPHYNIAVRCGAGSRLWVLDVDRDRGGAEHLDWLIRKHGPLPRTLAVMTANGRHLYFTTDLDLPSAAGKIAAGIDTRGRGGYIVAPPSIHPSGKVYRWVTQFEAAPPPQWLVNLACRREVRRRSPPPPVVTSPRWSGNGNAYGRAALASEIDALAATSRGARNARLNAAAFKLFQLVAGGVLTETEVTAGLVRACHVNGLWADDHAKQCHATISSGARAGRQHPRGRS